MDIDGWSARKLLIAVIIVLEGWNGTRTEPSCCACNCGPRVKGGL